MTALTPVAMMSVFFVLPHSVAVAQDYLVTQIEPFVTGGNVYPTAVNDLQQAAGYASTSEHVHAFIFYGVTRDIGTLGGDNSYAYGINNNVWVVGTSDTGSGACHAFKWFEGVMTDLGTLGSANWNSCAYGVNDQNEVVGYSEDGQVDGDGNPIVHAVKWDSNGVIHDLGVYHGDVDFIAYDINNYGDVVGASGGFSEPDHYALEWVGGGGQILNLGSLGGTSSAALSINDAGAIGGFSTLGDGNQRAVKWTSGVMKNLGALNVELGSLCTGINEWGEAVGSSQPQSGQFWHAIRWVGGHDTLQDINDYLPNGYDNLFYAFDCSGIGTVVCQDDHLNGYLLTPPNLQIVLYGPDPGYAGANNTYTVYGCTPGGSVRIYYGLRNGSTAVPGCPGVTVDINSAVLGVTTTANGSGRASVVAHSPNAARNRVVRLQAVDMSTCRVSQLVQFRYR